jgi:hypothetical protein
LRGVLAGVCCAAVLLGANVSGMGEDKLYERVTKEEVNSAREVLKEVIPYYYYNDCIRFSEITGNFQRFLCNSEISGNLALWHPMLILLSPEVSYFLHGERYWTCKLGLCTTAFLVSSGFSNLVKFCESEYCDPTSNSIIYDYLDYIGLLLDTLDPTPERDRVMSDLKK